MSNAQPTTIDATARDITPVAAQPTLAQVEAKLPKLTPQQEAFVIAFLRYGNATQAYRLAYRVGEKTKPNVVWANASKLVNHSKVTLWIDHLRRQIRGDNLNTILLEFDQNRNGALEVGNYSAANGATRGKAQVLGLIPRDPDAGAPTGTTINIILVEQDAGLF